MRVSLGQVTHVVNQVQSSAPSLDLWSGSVLFWAVLAAAAAPTVYLLCVYLRIVYERVQLRRHGSTDVKQAQVAVEGIDFMGELEEEWPGWKLQRLPCAGAALVRPEQKKHSTALLYVPGLGRVFTHMPMQESLSSILKDVAPEKLADICGLDWPWYGSLFNSQGRFFPYLLNEWDRSTAMQCIDEGVDALLQQGYDKVIVIANSTGGLVLYWSLCLDQTRGLGAAMREGKAKVVLTNPALAFKKAKKTNYWRVNITEAWNWFVGSFPKELASNDNHDWYYYTTEEPSGPIRACFKEPNKVLVGRPKVQLVRNSFRGSVNALFGRGQNLTLNYLVKLPAAYQDSLRIGITQIQEDEIHCDVAELHKIAEHSGVKTIPTECHEPELFNDEVKFAAYMRQVLEVE